MIRGFLKGSEWSHQLSVFQWAGVLFSAFMLLQAFFLPQILYAIELGTLRTGNSTHYKNDLQQIREQIHKEAALINTSPNEKKEQLRSQLYTVNLSSEPDEAANINLIKARISLKNKGFLYITNFLSTSEGKKTLSSRGKNPMKLTPKHGHQPSEQEDLSIDQKIPVNYDKLCSSIHGFSNLKMNQYELKYGLFLTIPKEGMTRTFCLQKSL
jgi:hypothetical protein